MLSTVGNPVAVSPDISLMRAAQRKNWSIVEWKTKSPTPRWRLPACLTALRGAAAGRGRGVARAGLGSGTMSGHSKWATTKHQKAVVDARRAKSFAKLIKNIEVAARLGGGDLDGNPTLYDAVQKARKTSVPKDNIERAIKRGSGAEGGGSDYETLFYEAYGPAGIAMLIECLTDNRNRSASDVRVAVTRNGGTMADVGSTARVFSRKGVVLLAKQQEGARAHRGRRPRGDPRRRARRGQRPRRRVRDHQRPGRHRRRAHRGAGGRARLRLGRGLVRARVHPARRRRDAREARAARRRARGLRRRAERLHQRRRPRRRPGRPSG